MPEPTDKAGQQSAAPAGSASAVAPTGDAGTDQGQAAQAQSPDPLAQINALNEEMARLKKETQHQRALHDRQMARMRAELAPQPPVQPVLQGQGGVADPDATLVAQLNQEFQTRDQRAAELEYQTELNSFKVDNPDWREDWEDMQRILGDDGEVQSVVVYKPNGSVDYRKTLAFTRNMVQNTKYGAARKQAEAERARLEAERAAQQQQAVISGSGAYSVPEGVNMEDISKMTPREMIEKGVFPVDPNDPPVFD